MHVSTRSYLSAGVAVLGAGAIALSPVQPLGAAPHRCHRRRSANWPSAWPPRSPGRPDPEHHRRHHRHRQQPRSPVERLVQRVVRRRDPPFPNTGICLIGCNGNLGWRTGGYSGGVGLPILAQMLSNLQVYLSELPDIGTIAGQIFGNIGNALRAPFEPG